MDKFVDLGTSIFDKGFTLNPHLYLSELYDREDVLGFKSDGMNFVFRFDQARTVMFNKNCRREPLANLEIEAKERVYAERYPNRAKNFQLGYLMGTPDLKLKKHISNYVQFIATNADYSSTTNIFEQLTSKDTLENYIESVSTAPLRIMLKTSGLSHTEEELLRLYQSGFFFVKALDNFVDETPLKDADEAVAYVWQYVEKALQEADADAPMKRFVSEGEAMGIPFETLIVNISAFLIISLSNTAGISSSYLLRNLILNPNIRQQLQSNPELIQKDSTIMEFLRRDNHVKALSRQVHDDFNIGEFSMRKGESINIFFPGINLDPTHWHQPLSINFNREFTGENNIIFGGSMYTCIGKQLGMAFLKRMLTGFVESLPATARIDENEIEVDGDWVAERVITRMPIHLC